MEILDTSSKQCKILIQGGKKYVIRVLYIVKELLKYASWNNNSRLTHLYNNTSKISDDRKLSVIHGDRHKKNAFIR